jgi:hypothetical protein
MTAGRVELITNKKDLYLKRGKWYIKGCGRIGG